MPHLNMHHLLRLQGMDDSLLSKACRASREQHVRFLDEAALAEPAYHDAMRGVRDPEMCLRIMQLPEACKVAVAVCGAVSLV
jgi:hypothetical protein